MTQYFYAYHGPNNNFDFEPSGGYGVGNETKQKKTHVGDMVFVIQKRGNSTHFELCGLYRITGHYHQESSPRPFRMKLIDTQSNKKRIVIDEEHLSRRLPITKGNKGWSNFKRHFCRQGASFESPLEPEVVWVLNELLEIPNPVPSNVEVLPMEENVYVEGGTVEVLVNRFERNREARLECIKLKGAICSVCGLDFNEQYGASADSFIHVHHVVPLSEIRSDYVVDPLEHLIPVCPNCHAMIHKLGLPYDVLKKRIALDLGKALAERWGD